MSRNKRLRRSAERQPETAEAEVGSGDDASFSLVLESLAVRFKNATSNRQAAPPAGAETQRPASAAASSPEILGSAWTALLDQLDERRRLERVIASALDAIITLDNDSRIVLFNTAAERLFRCPAHEATGHSIGRFLPLQSLDLRGPTHGQLSAAEDARASSGTTPHQSLQATRADGSSFPVEVAVCKVGAPGELLRTIIVRDVALRRRAEQALGRLSVAVEQSGDGICITDRDGIIEYVNPAFERLIGFTRHEMIGRRPGSFSSGSHDPAFYENLWETVLAGDVFRRVFIDRKADGDVIHLDETITPLTDDDGRITHFVAFARDVTPRIRTEEALRRLNDHLEDQARAIAQALHDEAGQLLTSAHIALSEAAHGMPQPVRDRLREAGRHLDSIEEQLRRLAHELRPPILDDKSLLAALVFLAEGVERRWGISVVVEADLAERLPRHVESAVYRMVQEALTNVTKHARASRAIVRLARTAAALTCTIEDDGIGFDSAAMRDGRASPGMGLQGGRDRVEALGGTLDISSPPGRGATLVITIPLEA